jgi:hypothetical protein
MEDKTKVFKSEQVYLNSELCMVSDEQIKFSSGLDLISIMEDGGAVRYSRRVQGEDKTVIIAEVHVIMP